MDTLTRLRRIAAEVMGLPLPDVSPEDSITSAMARMPSPPLPDRTPPAPASFIDGLSPDSLTRIELTVALEEEFARDLPGGFPGGARASLDVHVTLREMADQIDRWRGTGDAPP